MQLKLVIELTENPTKEDFQLIAKINGILNGTYEANPIVGITWQERLESAFSALGVNQSLAGYLHLISILQEMIKKEDSKISSMNSLYEKVGVMHNVPAPTVERNIRYLLSGIMANNSADKIRRILGKNVATTTKQFINQVYSLIV